MLPNQTTQLFSTDGAVFLYVTGDGNVILYNTANYNTYGAASAGSIIWQSNTGGHSALAPFQFTMQNVRAPCLQPLNPAYRPLCHGSDSTLPRRTCAPCLQP